MSHAAAPDAYYRTIEEEFNRRRGAPMLLSPRDWTLIGEWLAAGVPLRIVLQGIANVFEAFERRAPSARRINSLSYCRQEVLSLFELYLGMRGAAAGRPGAAAPADPSRALLRHLGRLTRRVREAMSICSQAHLDPLVGALAGAAAELKEVRKEVRRGTFDPQMLEELLTQLEQRTLDAARRALPAEELSAIEERCNHDLREHRQRMSAAAFTATRRTHMATLLRRRCRLPRITLFDDPAGEEAPP